MKKVLILLVCTLFLCSCGNEQKEEKAEVKNVTCAEARELVDDGAVLVDVRTLAEYNATHLDDAINIAVDVIDTQIEEKVPEKDTKIIVYCRSGNRSATAAKTLIDMGYKNVYDLGGMENCKN